MATGGVNRSGRLKRKLTKQYTRLHQMFDPKFSSIITKFYYATDNKERDRIISRERIEGCYHSFPENSPLACSNDVIGVLIEACSVRPPNISRFGRNMIVMKAGDLLQYKATAYIDKGTVFEADAANEAEDREDVKLKIGSATRAGVRMEDKQTQTSSTICMRDQQTQTNRKTGEYKGNSRWHTPVRIPAANLPRLFFECAYYYKHDQYQIYRMVLAPRDNESVTRWCEETCKEVNIAQNPFLCYQNGLLSTHYKYKEGYVKIKVEVFLPGDVALIPFCNKPYWKGARMIPGGNPIMGVRPFKQEEILVELPKKSSQAQHYKVFLKLSYTYHIKLFKSYSEMHIVNLPGTGTWTFNGPF